MSTPDIIIVKQTRPRRVFGRREATIKDVLYRFEMRPDGVHVRQSRRRKTLHLSFEQMLDAAVGQLRLGI